MVAGKLACVWHRGIGRKQGQDKAVLSLWEYIPLLAVYIVQQIPSACRLGGL